MPDRLDLLALAALGAVCLAGLWLLTRNTHSRSLASRLWIAAAALATVGMNGLGQYLSGAAADPVMRWAMVATLVFIGGATVHASLHLPRLAAEHGWRDVRTLACVLLMIGGSAISLSRTYVSLSAILAANQDLARAEDRQEDLQGAALDAARARVDRAAEAVAALPSLAPLQSRLVAAQSALEAAQEAVRREAANGGCGQVCQGLKQSEAAARQTLSDARAAYDAAADRDRRARQTLSDAETALSDALAAPVLRQTGTARIVASVDPAWATAVKWLIMLWIEFAIFALPLISDRRKPSDERAEPVELPTAAATASGVLSVDVSSTGLPIPTAPSRELGSFPTHTPKPTPPPKSKRRRRPIDAREGAKILRLRAEGLGVSQIARRMGRAHSTVSDYLSKRDKAPETVKAA